MKLYTDISASAQAAYAGLDVAARDSELRRSVANLGGGFTRKHSHGKDYWYYQWKMPDGVSRQIFVGPDDSQTKDLIARHSSPEKGVELAALLKLTRAALEYGCSEIPIKHGRIIGRLLDHGFFKAGGILVGTHAFLAYQNMFGIRWNSGAYTLDIDFAHAGKKLSLAIASNVVMDTTKAIDSLEMGFIPVASKTTFKKPDEPDLDLDFLTTRGRTGDEPVFLKSLNLTLQPSKFMELSLEDPVKSTLLVRNGPIVVNIPRPQRFALHKLIVHGERGLDQRTKSTKDLVQAAALLDYLLDHDLDLVKESWLDVSSRGPGWQQRLNAGWKSLTKTFPDQNYQERLDMAV